MKVLLKVISVLLFIYALPTFVHANEGSDFFSKTEEVKDSNVITTKDSLILNDGKWPKCPGVENSDLIILDDKTFLLKWDNSSSSEIEYNVQVFNNEKLLFEERNNSGIYIFQLDQELQKENITVSITSLCYYDYERKPINSAIYQTLWEDLIKESKDFCDAYEDLINFDDLPSFLIFDTEFPADVNFKFEICQKDDCYFYNHSNSNSAIISKEQESYSILNPKLLTKYGNFSCDENRNNDDEECESIVVTELENCLYEITYSDSISPVCDLSLNSHLLTHSLCGHETGRIVVRPKDGNEPYHYAWNTGDEGFENDLNYLLPGTYTVTVTDATGCEIISSAVINESTSVKFYETGGDGGLVETLELPAGMNLIWKFNPYGVTDQCILSGQNLNLDTGPITNKKAEECPAGSNCHCSIVFMGDYINGAILPIESGNASKNNSFAVGEIIVPDDGVLNLNVIGANCGSGTAWDLRLECETTEMVGNGNDPMDLSYVTVIDEVESYLKDGIITKEKFQQDSTVYYDKELVFEKLHNANRSSTRSDETTVLDFRCSGTVASPYTIRMVNNETGEIFTCDIIDQVSCPECNEETDGCHHIKYTIESDPWDPNCTFGWKVNPGLGSELEIINENGDVVMQTSDVIGEWDFENGETFQVRFTLENDTISTICNFVLDCPEPDLPPIDDSICDFFGDFNVSLENESSLLFSSNSDLNPDQIEEFNQLISQISQIGLKLDWQLGPYLNDYLLFDAQNDGNANLFQLDPENMTFIVEDYDMNSVWDQILQGQIFTPDERQMQYRLKIVDIYGNEIICDFQTIVEFPEEEITEDNPLCLACISSDYDPNEDLEGHGLEDGEEFDGELTDQTIYIYGFPIYVTSYSWVTQKGEGILSLPFEKCKVLAVELKDLEVVELPIEKNLWIKAGVVQPHTTYPSEVPNFEIAPDFEFGAEICIPPRAPNDVNGDGIDDDSNLDKYGFDSNGQHINGTDLDNNGFDYYGNYMGCPRTDDASLPCSPYNDDGCDRDGLNASGVACPTINEEEWDELVAEFQESSDSLIAAIVCEFADDANEEKDEKVSECDSLRTIMGTYLDDPSLSESEIDLIKGVSDEYFEEGLSDHFTKEPKVPSPAVGGRTDLIKNIEKIHVKLYYCDLDLQPLEEDASKLSNLCAAENTAEIQSLINAALAELSNLDKQRLLLDENAFNEWVKNLVKEHMKETHKIHIGAVFPQSFEIDLFDQPTRVHYQGAYNSVASAMNDIDYNSDFNIMDAIDFEYEQGFDEINGVTRAYYVSQIGKYNQERYSSLSGVEPIAIQSVQLSSIFSIYLVNFRFNINKPALVDAYIELSDPKSDRKIYFSAKDVKYHPKGIEEAEMQLATTISKFKISNAARGTILKGPETFLKFNCEGVKQIGIKGEVEFCDNIIVPMQQIGDKNDYERHDDPYFTMGFNAIFTEWLEFETQITAGSPFAMAKQKDLIWKVPSFSFDFSSSSSQFAGNFSVPGGFNSEFVEGSTLGPGWKGFYCESLEAVLPAITKSSSGDRHTALNVSDLLIDKYGVTCSAEVSAQILGLGEANMKSGNETTGWSLSIDYFRLDAVQNFIVGGGLKGQIITSLFTDSLESALDYTALIFPGQKYKFSITPKVDLKVPLLVADAEIKSAAIDVTYDAGDGSFDATAKFSGNIKINNDIAVAALPYLKFNNLTVMNKTPYIQGGKWELKGNPNPDDDSEEEDSGSYKGFTFSLENLKFEDCEGGPILSTTINVGFGLNGDNGGDAKEIKSSNLNISGDFGLRGEFSPNASGIQGFKFDKAFLNGLSVSGNIGEAVKDIEVKLCWDENNLDYGDTFYGSGKATIFKFGEVGVAAQFGKKDNEKYFFIDAFSEIPTVPIGGPIGVDMIGIGVSNNMVIQNNANGNGSPAEIANSDVCSPPSCASSFGQTYSGFSYGFDASKALAVRFSLGFGMVTVPGKPPSDFVDGSAGIDITFNDGGGIHELGFFGEATLLANFPDKLGKVVEFINELPTEKLGDIDMDESVPLDLGGAKPEFSETQRLMARVEGEWNFTTGIFELEAGAYLDWGVLKGAGVDNALALGKFRIGGGEWNISLGTPLNPSGVDFNLGIVSANFKTYFMAGNPLAEPWVPYMPPKVSSFFDNSNDFEFLDNMPANGAGIAFGVHFAAGFEISVPVLGSAYADLMAGIDVAMINGITCNGNPIGFGSGDKKWYAMGQAYLYAGAGLKVLGVDLIKGEAGIMMNAGLTNPSFFNGRLKVSGKFGVWPLRFTISGGIDVDLGDEPSCVWYVFDEGEVFEVLGELSIVKNTFPTNESKDISTGLNQYLIDYSLNMGEILELDYEDTLSNGDIVIKTIEYKVDVSRIELVSTKTGLIRDYNPSDDGDSDVVEIYNSLASEDSIIAKITYNVEMKIPGTDKFIDAITEQVVEYNFKTGPLALRFESGNISGSYPANGMNNFYLDHRLEYKDTLQGIVGFENRFPWEIFDTPGIQVRSALYEGSNVEPIIDELLNPTRFLNVETGELTNAGSIFFTLPEEMGLGKNYKVIIYALRDGKDEKMHLMDPIHFRTSLYHNLEDKFAESDSMFYVEASPRNAAWSEDNLNFTYVCGFEYNLVSKPDATESWDEWDAKYMYFSPLCEFDYASTKPKINSADFIDCEYEEIDEPPVWEDPAIYEFTSVADVLTTPSTSTSFQNEKDNSSTRASVTGVTPASLDEVRLRYRFDEILNYKSGGFLLKGCQ